MGRKFTVGDDGGSFTPWPVGTHLAEIIGHELKDADEKSDYDSLQIELKGIGPAVRGKTMRVWLEYRDSIMWRVTNYLVSAGVPSGTEVDLDAVGHFNRKLNGRWVEITLYDDTYQGKTRRKVRRFSPAPPNAEQIANAPAIKPPSGSPQGGGDWNSGSSEASGKSTGGWSGDDKPAEKSGDNGDGWGGGGW